MSEIYNHNTKRPKPKENQLGILGISSREFVDFAEISAEGLGSRRERCWDYVAVFENTPKKLLRLRRKRMNQWAHLEQCHRNPDILERVLNQIALSNLTVGKCVPMQVIKEPEHRRTSTTEEQK